MCQRIANKLKNLTVEFSLITFHDQLDLLVKVLSSVTNDTRNFLPRIADWLHAGLHDRILQFACYVRQTLQWCLEFRVVHLTDHLKKLVTCENQFGHHVHQVLEHIHVYADRLACTRCARCHFRLVRNRFFDRCSNGCRCNDFWLFNVVGGCFRRSCFSCFFCRVRRI